MKIVFLVTDLDRASAEERSVITRANFLAQRHDVVILSVYKTGERPSFEVAPRVRVRYLISTRSAPVTLLEAKLVQPEDAARLHELPSLLVPDRWRGNLTGLADLALETALRELHVDAVVTTTSALLALAVQLLPAPVAVVHHEQRAAAPGDDRLELLMTFGARADLIVVPTETMCSWLPDQFGPLGPRVQAISHPLPEGFLPRSRLNAPLIMAAGRLTPEAQFSQLIRAFGLISDRLPGWKLRIFGEGPRRHHLDALTRKLKLFDRVELPGSTTDVRSEWARASIGVVTSRTGSALAAQEAMAAGVPVVGHDSPGLRELIESGSNGLLVPANSIMALRSALLRLAQDPQLVRRLGDGAAESAHRFAPGRVGEQWEAALIEAAERPVGPAADSRLLRSTKHSPRARERRALSPDASADGGSAPPTSTHEVSPPALTPSDAGRIALDWAVDTAKRTGAPWFVIPPVGESVPTLVVPDTVRDRFLDLLRREGVPDTIGMYAEGGPGWQDMAGSVEDMAAYVRDRQAPHARLQAGLSVADRGRVNLYTHRNGVDIEFWHVDDGLLEAPRRNPYVQSVSEDEPTVAVEIGGVQARSLPLMAGRTVYDPDITVDVVYTWVDGSDPAWLARRDARLRAMSNERDDERSTGAGRYLSRDELRYSLRSVFLFAPWVRHVFLVTDAQRPGWLQPDHPRITVVDHRDILEEEYLPTFNSHAIETGIHRIPGLSEHFIYFNDDVFLGRPVAPNMFFSPSGQPAIFPAPGTLGLKHEDAPPWLHAAFNNRELLERDFGRTILNAMLHTPHPMRRSVLEELEDRYPGEFKRTAAAPFRSSTDVSVLSSLAQHYGLLKGTAYLGELEAGYISLAGADLGPQLRQLLAQRDQDVFCLADFHEHALPARRVEHLTHNFLVDYFPLAAPWEVGTAPDRHSAGE